MSFFVVTYAYTPDVAARDAVRATHREWLASLGDTLVLSGPTDADGAFLVFEDESAAAVEKTLDADPFVVDGRIVGARSVAGWTPVLGRAKDRL
jgi:uncharacterized protein YciI